MRICQLKIQNFRGIKTSSLIFPNHVVLVGDNNTGKSTVLEAIDLLLGPDRLNRFPVIDEHDFYLGKYQNIQGEENKIILEATITDLNDEQKNKFYDSIEWWDEGNAFLYTGQDISQIDISNFKEAIRVTFIGYYDSEDDDFKGNTYYSRSLMENDSPQLFTKKDKQFCGFLYLRALRTGTRALSLEHGSLLDIILRLKEIRPQLWEKTINRLSSFELEDENEIGLSTVLSSIQEAINKYVPKEWGSKPHLKISNLTRENLRKIITSFVSTGENGHSAPYYRQGSGTINIMVLAMLSQIAEDRRNVIFGMEEPETAIPPYAQKRIIHEINKLSSQSFFTSHSPYVIEEFNLEEVVILRRDSLGELKQSKIELPDSIKHKKFRKDFRNRFCEGLLSRRIIIAEGATENSSLPVVARRLSELESNLYSSLESLGFCIIDAEGEGQIKDLSILYCNLGKDVYVVCDKQTDEYRIEIEAIVKKLFMHDERGFELLVLKNTTSIAKERFIDNLTWPQHLIEKYPNPKAQADDALLSYFKWSKGNWGIADFLTQCNLNEIPDWIKQLCLELKEICNSNLSINGSIDTELTEIIDNGVDT